MNILTPHKFFRTQKFHFIAPLTSSGGGGFTPTFNTSSSPHASWAQFGYTDFRLNNLSFGGQAEINTELNYMAGHLDSIMSGIHSSSYDVVGVKQIPYTLFFQSKIYDNGSDFTAWHLQAANFCANRGFNEEDIYLHLSSGQTNFAYPIQYISQSGQIQLLWANQYAFISSSNITIAGNGLAGTYAIISQSYVANTASVGTLASGIQQIFVAPFASSTMQVGTATPDNGDGTKTPYNRLVAVNLPFYPPWWLMNPQTSASLEFQVYRNNNLITGSGFNYAGVFCDSYFKDTYAGPCLENPSTIAYANQLATHVTSLRARWSGSIFRINNANFIDPTSSIGVFSAGSSHFEEYNNPQRFNWFSNTNNFGFLVTLVKSGSLIELVNSFGCDDVYSGGGGLYVNDFKPIGFKDFSTLRGKVAEYGQYLACLQSGSNAGIMPNGGGVIFHWANDEWDVTTVSGSVQNRWLPMWEYNIGRPLNALHIIITGVDGLGQTANIRMMDFESASLFFRGNDTSAGTN